MNLLYELNTTNSNTLKLAILKTYLLDASVDASSSRLALFYTYNPYFTYGVKFSIASTNIGQPSEEMFTLLDNLRHRKLTGNAAREAVENFAACNGNLIKLICNKDLACGITATSINKVLKGFIPTFNLQLAKEVPLNTLTYPLLGQLKYDGVRVVAIIEDGIVTFRTRSGKTFEAPEFNSYLSMFKSGVLDGEMVLDTGKVEDRPKVSGMINSALHGTPLDTTNVSFYIFDHIPLQDFKNNHCNIAYKHRHYSVVEVIYKLQEAGIRKIKLAETIHFNSAEEVNKEFEKLLAEGYEGLILKSPEHKYTFKRSKDWVKVKAVKDCDLKCVGVTEGTGNREDGIGALCCVGVVDGFTVAVNVGSGLNKEDVFKDPSEFINKVVTIKYNDIITNKVDNTCSLFLPRFVCVRGDL
jgi:DNA ligase 1